MANSKKIEKGSVSLHTNDLVITNNNMLPLRISLSPVDDINIIHSLLSNSRNYGFIQVKK